MKIGVLALQGAFREHIQVLNTFGCKAIEIKKSEQLDEINGLIIPGGESTTIGRLMNVYQLFDKIVSKANGGMPVFGTCAGCVILAKDIENSAQPRLGLMDITVTRNAFGRQVDSFEADLNIPELGENPFKGVFIRAPIIKRVESNVEVMAKIAGNIVMVRQDNLMACSFHPELTLDKRIHQYFLNMVIKAMNN